jgi:3,4-dihydroxy 2-butanone 4-phosphate synthase/GTP cyclohydrolase II
LKLHDRIVSIEQGIEDIRNGKMVILVDDEDRENEGDLCCAAGHTTPERINFMATYGRGLICLTVTEDKAQSLGLKPMVEDNESPLGTAFTTSIDAYEGVTTGISAQDRAHTILTAVAADAKPEQFAQPGHVFPLIARKGGVLVRPGQTEGSVDLAKLAGLPPVGVICEIMKEDGSMARMPDLIDFGETHDINIVTIASLIQYRMAEDKLIELTNEISDLPRIEGNLKVVSYTSPLTPDDVYVALIKGDIKPEDNVLVRIHRECFLGDLFGSQLCDCSQKLNRAREMISNEGKGVLLYVRRKDFSSDAHTKLAFCGASEPIVEKKDISKALVTRREFLNCGVCAKILLDQGIRNVRSITSNPDNQTTFKAYGLELSEMVSLS